VDVPSLGAVTSARCRTLGHNVNKAIDKSDMLTFLLVADLEVLGDHEEEENPQK
jgi:hypothetical protein